MSTLTEGPPATPLPGVRSQLNFARWAVAPLVLLSVGLLAAGNGGFFPPAWGWSAVALLWAAGIALIVAEPMRLRRMEWITLGSFTGLGAWMLISQLWEGAATQPVQEAERMLVYVAGLAACMLLTRRADLRPLLTGLLLAVVGAALYGLAGRVVPGTWLAGGSLDTGRMSQPIGYWNGLGVFAAIGVLVALGLAAHVRSLWLRMLAAGCVPPLVCAIYFTYSRGSWAALGVGLVAALFVDRRRGMLLLTTMLTAVPAAVAVAAAATSGALTHAGSPAAQVVRQGHRLGAVLAVVVAAELAVALLIDRIDLRWSPSRTATRIGHAAAGVAVVLLMLGAFAAVGSPVTMGKRLYDGFNGRSQGGFTAKKGQVGRDLNMRLFSLSGNSRATLWRIAWADVRRHPLLGSGAGSYERVYLGHRTSGLKVIDAHSLYLETLAELGPIGLGLLLLGLGAPLIAGIRGRGHPLLPAALGGYVAYLAHAGVDWDWELPAVTLGALVLAVAMMRARHLDDARPLGRPVRIGGLVVIGVLTVAALVGLRGNLALADSRSAANRGDWAAARSDAERATTWAPWSSDAWVALGDARLGANVPGGNAAYRHALRLDDGDWTTWFAIARSTSGATSQAALRRALALNPHGNQLQVFLLLRGGQSATP